MIFIQIMCNTHLQYYKHQDTKVVQTIWKLTINKRNKIFEVNVYNKLDITKSDTQQK